MPHERRGSEYSLPISTYERLLTEVREAGCFRRTYTQYICVTLITVLGLTVSAYGIVSTDTLWIQILNACLAGFLCVQLGLIGHDLSHAGVFQSKTLNRSVARIVWGLGCGLSESRWFRKHNAHHQSPNHIGYDPDLKIPFAFSEAQALQYSTFYQRYIFPRQHTLFWIGLGFVYPYNILHSMRFLLKDSSAQSVFEVILMSIHFVLVLGFTFFFLPPMTAVLFNLVVFLVVGLYMGMIFAPNHKGEDMLAPEGIHNWVHQITLTRNITPSFLVSYILGGLEYQIEHHLFLGMSRFQYPRAQAIVKEFCAKEHIPYTETSWTGSLKCIHTALRDVARMYIVR